MPFNELDEFDDLSIGDLTDLLTRTSAGGQPKQDLALDSQAEGIVVRWQTRFDDSFLVYTFTVGERRYWFAWESPFDEAHRGRGDSMWYDAIRRGTRFEVRYQASDRAQHLARFGDHQIQGRFLQVRSTLREAFIAALPAADYSTLTTLVDRVRTIEHDDLTFLLVRVLLEPLSGLPASGLREQIAALKPRYSKNESLTDPHDGACSRFRRIVGTLLDARPGDSRRIATACLEPMALFTANNYASHHSLQLAMDLIHLFDQRSETAELVPDFATFALVLTPSDPYYDAKRASLVALLRAARR